THIVVRKVNVELRNGRSVIARAVPAEVPTFVAKGLGIGAVGSEHIIDAGAPVEPGAAGVGHLLGVDIRSLVEDEAVRNLVEGHGIVALAGAISIAVAGNAALNPAANEDRQRFAATTRIARQEFDIAEQSPDSIAFVFAGARATVGRAIATAGTAPGARRRTGAAVVAAMHAGRITTVVNKAIPPVRGSWRRSDHVGVARRGRRRQDGIRLGLNGSVTRRGRGFGL